MIETLLHQTLLQQLQPIKMRRKQTIHYICNDKSIAKSLQLSTHVRQHQRKKHIDSNAPTA